MEHQIQMLSAICNHFNFRTVGTLFANSQCLQMSSLVWLSIGLRFFTNFVPINNPPTVKTHQSQLTIVSILLLLRSIVFIILP